MRISRAIGGGVIILGVLLTLPWVDGFVFKRNYYHFVKALRADKAVNIDITEYQEGWFSSKAKISITSKRSGNTTAIILDQSISHGPLAYDAGNQRWIMALATIRSNIHLPAALEAMLLGTQTDSGGVVESNAIATLGGDYLNQIKTPVFNMNLPNSVDVVWQGLTGSMKFEMHNRHLQSVITDVTIGAVAAKGNGISLTTHEAKLQYNLSPDGSGLWNGSYSLTLPDFALSDASGSVIYAGKNITLAYLFGVVTPSSYSANVTFSMDQLNLPKNWQITQLHNNLAFESVNKQGLVNLVNTIHRFKENP